MKPHYWVQYWSVMIPVVTKPLFLYWKFSYVVGGSVLLGLHLTPRRLTVFLLHRWGGQAALTSAPACNNAIKVMPLHSAFLVWNSVRFVGSMGHTLLRALHTSILKVLGSVIVAFSVVPAVIVMQIESFIESAVNAPRTPMFYGQKALSFQIHEAALLNSVLVRYYSSGY